MISVSLVDPVVDSTAIISPRARIGPGTKIWSWTKVREDAVIGADVCLGQGVYVDVGVTIGDKSRIQNAVQIYQGVTIGKSVFIGPHVTFTNDPYPRADGERWRKKGTLWQPTEVEDGVSVGAGAVILCGITLGKRCMIAAGAVVTRSVPPFVLVMGQPAIPRGFVGEDGCPRSSHDIDSNL